MTPIRVILLSGYLGAGKTTCLNRLLDLPLLRGRRLALIINEFGKLGVDGQLVKPGAYTRFDLNRGSVFCICIKTDFVKTLRTIAEDTRPEWLVVEATGVADPCDLEDFMDTPGLRGRYEVAAVLVLVDAVNFTRVAPYMTTARRQVRHADGVIINKTDLVPPEDADRLAALLRDLNPRAVQVRAVRGGVDSDFVTGLTHTRAAGQLAEGPPTDLHAVSVGFAGPVDRGQFLAALRGLDAHLLRAKGAVDFGNGPEWVEAVFDRITVGASPPAAGLPNACTVIAWGLPADAVRSRFAALGSVMP